MSLLELCWEEEEGSSRLGSSRLVSASLSVVGECVVLNDGQVIGPPPWGRLGGFIDEPAGLQYG